MKENSMIKSVECALIVLACIAMMFMLFEKLDSTSVQKKDNVSEVTTGWYYMKDGKRVDLELPAVVTQETGDELILYCDGLTEADAGDMLTTRAAVYELQISEGEDVLYQYEDQAFPRNRQMKAKVHCTAQLSENYNGETIAFVYKNTSNGKYKIGEVYTGSRDAVFKYYCYEEIFTILMVFIMVVMAIVSIGISFYLKYMNIKEQRFADVAIFLLLCAVWFITDSQLVQSVSGSAFISYVSFFAFMLLIVPGMYLVKHTRSLKSSRALDVIICLAYLNVIVQSLLNYMGVFDFVQMLFVTHILLFVGFCVIMRLLWREYKESGNRELLMIFQLFWAVAGGGLISIGLYWILKPAWYELVFGFGIIALFFYLLHVLVVMVGQNLHYRTEAEVYQRLSMEDCLTGMQNRKAFQKYMAETEGKLGTYKNLTMICMKLEKLKSFDDSLGLHIGDELIIAASRCIAKAFGEMGDCFRTGEEEFCVVLCDNSETEEELSARLDEELRQSQYTSRYQVSVARGISYVRDSQGNFKSFNDWKQEADFKCT